ncbi:hypothetical protein BDK51DRAFT_46580 [Blyttiomyces helicus]|uniref:Uncharacterized protein n=1 Tax=Blyttiomyces helicus TaxID=388810 RepID=A0A4P9WC94_9FUNG|nr:hypothetical protein BDK51DRAFT_46580 [Blyttiomyces helicus]|eukprot:RKO90269.1 hypothetical protein BDK51DRAFT_46580 [Blyttiomyces helicus]
MSQHANLVLLLNLGGQIVYVFQHRMAAQDTPAVEIAAVLDQIIATLLDSALLEDLATPQPPYSLQSLRSIVERIAHSSSLILEERRVDEVRVGCPDAGMGRRWVRMRPKRGPVLLTRAPWVPFNDATKSNTKGSLNFVPFPLPPSSALLPSPRFPPPHSHRRNGPFDAPIRDAEPYRWSRGGAPGVKPNANAGR